MISTILHIDYVTLRKINNMSSSTSNYCCKYCKKGYIKKHNFDRHVSTCEFFYKTKDEQADILDNHTRVPSMREMYSLLQDMSLRIQKLEKDNTNLRQTANRQANPLTMLKIIKPEIGFSDWLVKYVLPDINQHLDTVLNNTLYDGIHNLLEQVFDDIHDRSYLPIQFVSSKQMTLYVYDSNSENKNTWKMLTNSELNKHIGTITRRFHVEFGIWWENKRALLNEQDDELFPGYFGKIFSDDKLCRRQIKKLLCSCLSNKDEII